MRKSYAEILGVQEKASSDEIKKAYRRMAVKCHPDLNNSSRAEEMFKNLNEAYKFLLEQAFAREKKAANNLRFESEWQEFFKNSRIEWDKGAGFKDLFLRHEKKPADGKDFIQEVIVHRSEIAIDRNANIKFKFLTACIDCRGIGLIKGDVCKICKGNGEKTVLKEFRIKIPRGVGDKLEIRIPEEGGSGKFGGRNGDLILKVILRST